MTEAINTSVYNIIAESVRTEAARILEDGTVTAVIGYAASRRKGTTRPVVIRTASDASCLVFSHTCVNNLAVYLTKSKRDVPSEGRIGIVVKGCDLKALSGLIGESQLKRENLYLIGIPCIGVIGSSSRSSEGLDTDNIAAKCRECTDCMPVGCDFIPTASLPAIPASEKIYEKQIAAIEAMSSSERWAFWKEQFSKCIKCYACRQVCPFCFCEQCLCDRNRPQMVEQSPRPSGNFAWHIVRAMHLAGRCVGCAECERSCPMDIPLNLLNRKMAKELKEMFDSEAGFGIREKGPLATYDERDDQSFIR